MVGFPTGLCGVFPKKPTSGRGGRVITAAQGTSSTGASVESLRNQRQAVEDRSSQGVGMLSPTGATVEMRRNQRQAVVDRSSQRLWALYHGTLWCFPKKPTSGRGVAAVTQWDGMEQGEENGGKRNTKRVLTLALPRGSVAFS